MAYKKDFWLSSSDGKLLSNKDDIDAETSVVVAMFVHMNCWDTTKLVQWVHQGLIWRYPRQYPKKTQAYFMETDY